jgi:hypothetical protein
MPSVSGLNGPPSDWTARSHRRNGDGVACIAARPSPAWHPGAAHSSPLWWMVADGTPSEQETSMVTTR